jgi:hypothetical protein
VFYNKIVFNALQLLLFFLHHADRLPYQTVVPIYTVEHISMKCGRYGT